MFSASVAMLEHNKDFQPIKTFVLAALKSLSGSLEVCITQQVTDGRGRPD